MFEKLLVPLDGSAQAAVALPLARALAQQTGAAVRLLRVVPPPGSGATAQGATDAKNNLSEIAAELTDAGVRVDTGVRPDDDPGAAIVREARDWAVSAIVMATHGRSGLARVVRGSVAQRVVADSPVPVVLLRPGGRRVSRITTLLVPVDGTPGSSLALGAAIPLAQETGARLTLLQVVTPFLQDYLPDGMIFDPAWDEAARTSAQSYVDTLAGRLRESGIAATGVATLGTTAKEIVRVADDLGADVIVMSTHALTGPMRTLVGSVADEVVRTAHQPVALVRQRNSPII
jgi:nucleotide-binding universal stress UspA family protein